MDSADAKKDILAPSTWLQWISFSPVDLAGEFLDLCTYWRQSRRWRAVWALLPIILFLLTLGSFVAVGKFTDRDVKANWYADRANKEIELAKENQSKADKSQTQSSDEQSKRLPVLVDMMFRRVLQLNPNNKLAKYYVASQMVRYGSLGSARQIMEGLATTKSTGFTKAHSWLAMDLVERSQKGETIDMDTLKYHLKRGTVGKDIPPALLLVYSQLLQQENKTAESQEFLKRAAEYDPRVLLNSVTDYMRNGLPVQARATADLLVERIKDKSGELSEDNTVLAANAYVLTNRLDNAMEGLQKGLKRFQNSQTIARALSNAYRLKFRTSLVRGNNQVQLNLEYLDVAVSLDPTNVLIQEDLEALGQIGIGQTEESIETLRNRIATSGTSYVARLLLAQAALRRGALDAASNDYEVILAELPRMTLALNNLAMLYTQTKPPRLNESLNLIDRAIAIAPAVSEFHDSRGNILVSLNRTEESVECYVQALSTSPLRVSTREKLIASYEQLGQTDQVETQRAKLVEVQKQIEEQRVKMQAVNEQRELSVKPKEPSEVNTPAPATDDSSKSVDEPKELTPSVPSAL
jgi:tetratricopeptide (TPR) repeat protein